MHRKKIQVLLLSPGCRVAEAISFGVAHLVSLGSYLQAEAGCRVVIADLDYEKFLPPAGRIDIYAPGFDLIGISCYSSFDYLKSFYLAKAIRQRRPKVCLVAGGYHPSARPGDFTGPDSPFDYVVVGEGERPLAAIAAALKKGERLSTRKQGPDPVPELDALPRLDWGLLDRYASTVGRAANEVSLPLSRGCVFSCSFCMEGAKGKPGWRAYSPARAVGEVLALHKWLDLKDKHLFINDPLFGFARTWRREMLERLCSLALPVSCYWALSRVDLLDEEDLTLFHKARFGLGFGLESGDVDILTIVQKGGDAARYLDKFTETAEITARLGLPWGANIITGHPGETEATLENSARRIAELFALPGRLTGFLSVDPYRFYPGSRIDVELADYKQKYGTVVHREQWWNYPDMEFTSLWVDPSRTLSFRAKEQLASRLLLPVLRQIEKDYSYNAYAGEYYRRSALNQTRFFTPQERLKTIQYFFLWQELLGRPAAPIIEDEEVVALLREERVAQLQAIAQRMGAIAPAHYAAIRDVLRERFVDKKYLRESALDTTIPLLEDGSSTLSALHAYVLNYRLLDLQPGDCLLEWGGGTGYGAALAAVIVGETGRVLTVEIEGALAKKALANLAAYPQVEVCQAGYSADAAGFNKILYCYAMDELPAEVHTLAPGSRLLVPLADGKDHQVLTLATMTDTGLKLTTHGEVRYVSDKG